MLPSIFLNHFIDICKYLILFALAAGCILCFVLALYTAVRTNKPTEASLPEANRIIALSKEVLDLFYKEKERATEPAIRAEYRHLAAEIEQVKQAVNTLDKADKAHQPPTENTDQKG